MSLVHGVDPARVGAVIFDLGGVFLAGGPQAVVAFGERHGVPREAWDAIRHELFHDDGPWSAVERGHAPFAEFVTRLRAVIAEHGGSVSLEDAENFMENTGARAAGRLRHEIVAAAAALHTRMPTALLTNNIREWRTSWRSLIDCETLFDVVVDSCEVGVRKPEPAIYEITRERLGLPHESLFFVDDIGANLKTARAFGWQTLRYDDTARVLEVLQAIVELDRRAGSHSRR